MPCLPASRLSVFALSFLGALLLSAAWVSALRAEGELARALKSREAFFGDQEARKSRDRWLALIKEFEDAALAQYEPKHASRARYLGADLAFDSAVRFKQNGDYETSERLARRAVRDCPRCSHSADAQLLSGRSLAALGRLDEATKQLMKVELNYPDSLEVAEARRLLAQIRGGSTPTPEKKPVSGGERRGGGQLQAVPGQEPSPAAVRSETPRINIPPPPKARADGQAQVYFLSLVDHGPYTTVTAYLDKVTPYVYNLIPPARNNGIFRVYADLKGAVISPGTRLQLKENSALVRLVKMNQYQKEVTRVVLDLPEAYPYRPTFLNDPPRLVFQVAGESGALPAPGMEAQPDPPERPAPPPAAADSKSPVPAAQGPPESMVRQLGLKIRSIVIDPGHGGKDGGAAGYGLAEKDLVLKLAKKLAARIEKRLGLEVHLTRDSDKFITLERRTKIARDRNADLFISLHVNANSLAQVEGFETYVLNFATDRSAMAVAARENASVNKTVAELEDLLHIIAKNTKIAESRALAQALHKSAVSALNKKHRVRDLGVKEAPFYVLVGADIPSILLEIGFLSNEKEAARLARDDYLDLIADGLCSGLETYVKGFQRLGAK
ncbi:MAG: N-acetylmuramoyl-L-alanine amidase [Candidatus Adiutrix sp.]|jgi:N-acetylmuramoyl-L-alanine amidase|nr:N-acetylmuramoyl-L-alanine amidase [Candidatus Adiutrix sp.]